VLDRTKIDHIATWTYWHTITEVETSCFFPYWWHCIWQTLCEHLVIQSQRLKHPVPTRIDDTVFDRHYVNISSYNHRGWNILFLPVSMTLYLTDPMWTSRHTITEVETSCSYPYRWQSWHCMYLTDTCTWRQWITTDILCKWKTEDDISVEYCIDDIKRKYQGTWLQWQEKEAADAA
jgi:hypothetical protein